MHREEHNAVEANPKLAPLAYEKWEVLFRDRIVIKRRLLRLIAGLTSQSDARPDGKS